MLIRLLTLSRYMILIAVLGAWLAALLALLAGAYEVVQSVLSIPSVLRDSSIKSLVINLVESVDLFLLGTVFYLIAMGLFELFVDDRLELPTWLVIKNLDDLKGKLIKVIVVVIAVQFLAQVLAWKGGWEILAVGASMGLVIAALTLFLKMDGSKKD